MRAPARGLAVSFLLALVLPGTGLAQEKSLHWAELAVRARLDAEGILHVEERQVMIFTGDWNGGERRFNLRLGQHLTLQKLSRIDPATGSATPLVEGDLAQVDHYAWTDRSTLRWRGYVPRTSMTWCRGWSVSSSFFTRTCRWFVGTSSTQTRHGR